MTIDEKSILKVLSLSTKDFNSRDKLYSSQTLFTISNPIPNPPSVLFPLLYLLKISF